MKKRNLTQNEFDKIKRLLDLKVPVPTAARIIGKSDSVLYYVRRFPDMQSYLAAGRKRVQDSMERTALKKRYPTLIVHNPQIPMVEPMVTIKDPPRSLVDEIHEIHVNVKKLLDLMTP